MSIVCKRCKIDKTESDFGKKSDNTIYKFCNDCRKKLKSYKSTPKPMLQTPMPVAPEAQVVEPDETPEEPRYTPMPKKQFKNMPKLRALDDEPNSVSVGNFFN